MCHHKSLCDSQSCLQRRCRGCDAGVQHAPSQRSGFSNFLFQAAAKSQERITFGSEDIPPPPTLKPLASFEQTRFWIGGGRGAFKSPKLWLAAPSACPSYWHLVLLYQLLIKQCSRTASVKISMQRETGVCLPAVASRFWNKSRMLAFHY